MPSDIINKGIITMDQLRRRVGQCKTSLNSDVVHRCYVRITSSVVVITANATLIRLHHSHTLPWKFPL